MAGADATPLESMCCRGGLLVVFDAPATGCGPLGSGLWRPWGLCSPKGGAPRAHSCAWEQACTGGWKSLSGGASRQ
jgi:hypothetical protein